MNVNLLVFAAVSLQLYWVTSGLLYPDDSSQLCAIQPTCQSCLERSSLCAWCSEWNYSNSTIGKLRCNSPERLVAFGCPMDSIKRTSKGSVTILTDDEFQDVVVADQVTVQLRPQRIKVRLRPHSTESIHLKYRPAKNYPLDLYYLMDLTWSMKDDKETLVGLGKKMTDTLGTFTENFRLGFGSYADKPLMPYIFPGHEDNPCKGEHETCAPLYSFKHHMKLSSNIQDFIQQVNNSQVTGNVDNLEGGLDGVLQTIVCPEHIGWARQARKLMLIATDGLLHFAGEGKLGGVVKRNDFSCHLDTGGEYTMSRIFDYPSLAEISRLLEHRKVNLIFAVTEDRRIEYEEIAGLLEEKARVATLAANSSNILEIIEQSYKEILSKVVLRDNSSDLLNVEYFSNCGIHEETENSTSECSGIQEGEVYDFRIDLSMNKCPENNSLWKQQIVIDDALASEASKSFIEIELQCGCDCEVSKSPNCKNGIDECGICNCNYGWSGETCDCDERVWEENRLHCVRPSETQICSGHGECTCGSCTCDPGYNGKYCECLPCDKMNSIECGGKGTCECGICDCLDGWQGTVCQCPTGDELCIAPGSNDVCGNHGFCECGQCRCNVTAPGDGLLYRGTYCESSASAGGRGLCVLYEACVNATIKAPEEAKKICQLNKTSFYRTERVERVDTASDHYCIIRSMEGSTVCTVGYVYQFTKDNTVLLKIADKVCNTLLPAAVIPSVVFLAVVLMGLMIIFIWKCWVGIKDKREFAKFEREQEMTIYASSQNPLYKAPTSVFRVPAAFTES